LGILAAWVAVLAWVGFLVRPEEASESEGDGKVHLARIRATPTGARADAAQEQSPPEIADRDESRAGGVELSDDVAPEMRAPERIERARGEVTRTLEVLVRAGDGPIEGASVLVAASRRAHLLEDFESKPDGVRRETTDARGIATFEDLSPASYAIGAITPHGLRATTYQRVVAERPPRQQVVAFGGGSIAGRVFGGDGAPIEGDRVVLVERTPQRAARFYAAATTSPDGAYWIAGLGASDYSVYTRSEANGGRRIDVSLAPGESRRVDFGSSEPPATWSGTLRVASGAAAAGVDGFGVRERDRGESFGIGCDEQGRFSARVAPGSYRATLALGSRELDLGLVELESGAVERDLFVPGVTLTGRVNWFPATADSTPPRPDVRVLVRRASDGSEAEPIRALATSNGYSVVGLERGTYFVSVEPLELLGAGERGCEVEVDGTRDTIVLDLIVSGD
jgi:hypothetical protein